MLNDPLKIREVFHLCFLEEFLRKFDPRLIALKGGVNLRFYFKSRRYSEDMDLDLKVASIASVQNNVLRALKAVAFPMRAYGVREVIPPSIRAAKQTETTQRFKIHLMTQSGMDLFTKIEFSRRGFTGATESERVGETILREYHLASVIVQHYTAASAFEQKIKALADRSDVEARDVFDLHHLITFLPKEFRSNHSGKVLKDAAGRAAGIGFEQYRDSVVSFLTMDDQGVFGQKEIWEDMKRRVIHFLQEDLRD